MKNQQPAMLKTEYRLEKEQEELKKTYGIEEKNVVVVERKSRIVQIWRSSLRFMLLLLRITASIAVAVLAVIGLASLLFPEIRAELSHTAQLTLEQLRQFTGL